MSARMCPCGSRVGIVCRRTWDEAVAELVAGQHPGGVPMSRERAEKVLVAMAGGDPLGHVEPAAQAQSVRAVVTIELDEVFTDRDAALEVAEWLAEKVTWPLSDVVTADVYTELREVRTDVSTAVPLW